MNAVASPFFSETAPASPALLAGRRVLRTEAEALSVLAETLDERFDLAALRRFLGVTSRSVYCTKIASKLARTYTDRHGLKDLCQELLGLELSKQMQSSDWGAEALSEAQLAYAANDVLHLHRLRERLDPMLAREGRLELASACFQFLPHRVELDLAGWAETDIFAY